jgi:hypothetical protein
MYQTRCIKQKGMSKKKQMVEDGLGFIGSDVHRPHPNSSRMHWHGTNEQWVCVTTYAS